MKLPVWGQAADENCFEDSVYWEVSSRDLSLCTRCTRVALPSHLAFTYCDVHAGHGVACKLKTLFSTLPPFSSGPQRGFPLWGFVSFYMFREGSQEQPAMGLESGVSAGYILVNFHSLSPTLAAHLVILD